MSSPTPLLNTGETVEPQNQDALVTVLGVCLLVIGLCAFAGLILLCQQFQRGNASSDPDPAPAPVLTRRSAKPTATTTQFRPLSERSELRHRGDPHLMRQASATSLDPGPPPPALLSSSSALPTEPAIVRPSSGAAAFPAAAAAAGGGDASVPSGGGPDPQSASGSIHSGVGGSSSKAATTRSVEDIDISLLSRIDEALASGYMRPQQATQLLKSYGCDLEELLQVELSDSSVDGAGGTKDRVSATRLATAPILGSREPGLTAAVASVTAPVAALGRAAAAAAVTAPVVPAATSSGGDLQQPLAERHLRSPPAGPWSAAQRPGGMRGGGSGLSSPLMRSGGAGAASSGPPAAGGSGAGGAAAATVVDDALLLKLDMALASGCVRPEQATQLLKSYGCDLEDLLRDELGEAALGSGGGGAR